MWAASPLSAYAADITQTIDALGDFDDALVEIAGFDSQVDVTPYAINGEGSKFLVGQSSDDLVFQSARQPIVIDGRIDDIETLISDLSQMPSWRMIDPLPVLESYSMNKDNATEEGMEGFFS